jgi:hypothetical protein
MRAHVCRLSFREQGMQLPAAGRARDDHSRVSQRQNHLVYIELGRVHSAQSSNSGYSTQICISCLAVPHPLAGHALDAQPCDAIVLVAPSLRGGAPSTCAFGPRAVGPGTRTPTSDLRTSRLVLSTVTSVSRPLQPAHWYSLDGVPARQAGTSAPAVLAAPRRLPLTAWSVSSAAVLSLHSARCARSSFDASSAYSRPTTCRVRA